MYDYLVVGSGLYGAIFAHEAKAHGKSVLVIDKRPNIAGNIYTENIEGINVHKYGAHIFHTNNKKVWNYITQFAEFNRFTNRRLPTTRASSTRCPSICILLIRCGVWSRRRKLPPKLRSSAKKSPASRRTWKNRPSPLWAATSMRSSSRATPRSSGAAIARICPPSSSSDCLCA